MIRERHSRTPKLYSERLNRKNKSNTFLCSNDLTCSNAVTVHWSSTRKFSLAAHRLCEEPFHYQELYEAEETGIGHHGRCLQQRVSSMTRGSGPLQPGAVKSERISVRGSRSHHHRDAIPPPLVTGRRIGSGPPEIQTLAARQAGVLRTSTQRMRSSVSQAHRRAAFPTNLEWGPDSSKLKGRNSCPLSVYNFCFYLPGSAGNRTIS